MAVITHNSNIPAQPVQDVEERGEAPKAVAQEPQVWVSFAEKYPRLAEAFIYSVQEQLELLAGKMLDYGTGNMKAGTNLETEDEVRFALEGVWFRLNDKVQRWKNMVFTGQKPNNESLYDTFMDIANYAIIAKLISRGTWDDK